MQVSKEGIESILLAHSQQSDGFEWIFTFLPDENQSWTKTTFEYIVQQLRSNPDYDEIIEDEKLIVEQVDGGVFLEVNSIPHISKYCISESAKTVPHVWKTRVEHAKVVFPDELPVKIQSQIIEEKINNIHIEESWSSISKNYSILKAFVYKLKSDEENEYSFRITMIRESQHPSLNMVQSNVSHQNIRYMVQLCVTSHTNIQYVMNTCISMMQLLTQQKFPLSKIQQKRVMDKYTQLIKKILDKRGHYSSDDTDTYHFLAPKPITLERINLVEPGPDTYGILSIYKGYTVTDKADGERMLMYIDDDGIAYIMNNTFEIYETGLKATSKEFANSLIDGEYIQSRQRRDNYQKDIFAAFDIYFLAGNSVMNLPLMNTNSFVKDSPKTRYDALTNICAKSTWELLGPDSIDLRRKEIFYVEGKEMKEACHDILQGAKKLSYDVDGLIFTPADLSVYGYYPGRPVIITENVKWDRVLKWKPEEQNTIDFLVEEGRVGTDLVTKRRYKEFKLFTGYSSLQNEPITPFEGLRMRHDYEYRKLVNSRKAPYKAREFHVTTFYETGIEIAHVPYNNAGQLVCQDGSIIENHSIVEFAYDPSLKSKKIPISKRWIPLRVRSDKTRIFQKTKRLQKTANDISVATSIWRSIHYPVTREMITGVEKIPVMSLSDSLEERLLGIDDVYYARDIPRFHMLSVNMLDFHNQGIKKTLYSHIPFAKRDALLELACGMAGDLPRWRDCGYRFIMGVDISRDNITNPREGAYARMLKQQQAIKVRVDGIERVIYPNAIFLVGDCSKKFENSDAAGDDKDSRDLFQMLYSKRRNAPGPNYMRNYIGVASQGFSLVSCMFAIHYFFKTEDTLNGFLHNAAHNLRQGGSFIATFMDGLRVHEMLSQSQNGIIEGRKLDNTIPVWAIIRRYEMFDERHYYGKPVDVFLENINKMIPEYLVHYPTLVEKARQYNLEVESTGMFGDTFQNILQSIDRSLPVSQLSHVEKAVLALENDTIQTQFSFLNRWVIFKKV
jgi:hypothetical protein